MAPYHRTATGPTAKCEPGSASGVRGPWRIEPPRGKEEKVSRGAKETIELFWSIQDSGDYTRTVPLFAEDAVFVDPVYGEFRGREAIGEFMEKMVSVTRERGVRFRVVEIAGGGEVAWAQWVAETPAGEIDGCGVYRVHDGLVTYYRDYMNSPEASS